MFDEEVPASFARIVGHVCGVITVAMAALSGWGIWSLINAAFKRDLPLFGLVLVLIPVGLTVLFFRWAGVLTGHWVTHGRLAVPPSIYAGFGVLCAVMSLFGVYALIVPSALPIGSPIVTAAGTVSSGIVAYWCYYVLENRRK